MNPNAFLFLCVLGISMTLTAISVAQRTEATKNDAQTKVYELWENEPAPNRGADYRQPQAGGYPYLVNVNPDRNGLIPEAFVKRLKEIGEARK